MMMQLHGAFILIFDSTIGYLEKQKKKKKNGLAAE